MFMKNYSYHQNECDHHIFSKEIDLDKGIMCQDINFSSLGLGRCDNKALKDPGL